MKINFLILLLVALAGCTSISTTNNEERKPADVANYYKFSGKPGALATGLALEVGAAPGSNEAYVDHAATEKWYSDRFKTLSAQLFPNSNIKEALQLQSVTDIFPKNVSHTCVQSENLKNQYGLIIDEENKKAYIMEIHPHGKASFKFEIQDFNMNTPNTTGQLVYLLEDKNSKKINTLHVQKLRLNFAMEKVVNQAGLVASFKSKWNSKVNDLNYLFDLKISYAEANDQDWSQGPTLKCYQGFDAVAEMAN